MTYNFRVDTKGARRRKRAAEQRGSTLNVEISDESPLAGFTRPNSGQYIYRDVIRSGRPDLLERWSTTTRPPVDIRQGERQLNAAYVLAWDWLNRSKACHDRGLATVTAAAATVVTPETSPVTAAATTVVTPETSPA